jgi:hypothetical protein
MPLWGQYAHTRQHLNDKAIVVSATNRRELRNLVTRLTALVDRIEAEIEGDE